MKKQNLNWVQVPDHPYKTLITRGSGSGKTNALVNLISHQPETDKIYLHAKNPWEEKYQLLIKKTRKYWLRAFLMIRKLLFNTQMIWMILKKHWRIKNRQKQKHVDCIWWYCCLVTKCDGNQIIYYR